MRSELAVLLPLWLAACATTPPPPPPAPEAAAPAAKAPEPATTEPDHAALLAKAEALQAHTAAGKPYLLGSLHHVGELELRVDQLVSGELRRVNFSVSQGQALNRIAVLIERPDRWELQTGPGEVQVTRPWEAELPYPVLYSLLGRSRAQVITERLFDKARFVRRDGRLAEYAMPHEPTQQAQLEHALELVSALPAGPKRDAKLESLRAKLEGKRVVVDVDTGLIVSVGAPEPTMVQSWEALEQVPAEAFDVGATGDVPAPPAVESLANSVLIDHQPNWKPGAKVSDLDALLLDVDTGATRRVPVRGGIAMPGSFLPGRTKVVVSVTGADGAIRPVEVDLVTGANRVLGGQALGAAAAMFPAVSPDGKRVAVSLGAVGPSPFDGQLVLIDVATDAVTKLGAPMDHAFVSWLPKGDGLVLLRRIGPNTEEKKHVIGRLSLTGEWTPIIEGDHPVLLADGKRLLFLDAQRKWNTCGLDGRGVKLFGDGFADYGFPSPAPDGKRLVMMHVADGNPRPVVVDLATKKVRPATEVGGLFAYPAWR